MVCIGINNIYQFRMAPIENAPDEAMRWLLSRLRSSPPVGLGLQTNVKAHESSKRTAFYITAPFNVYVFL